MEKLAAQSNLVKQLAVKYWDYLYETEDDDLGARFDHVTDELDKYQARGEIDEAEYCFLELYLGY